VVGMGDPWSVPIETIIEWPEPARARFWTAWGDPRVEQAREWSDPLEPVPFLDRQLRYGSTTFQRSDGFCLPLATVLEAADDLGVTVALSPEDLLLDMDLRVTAGGGIVFSRTKHRISASSPVRFSMDIVSHAADWRGGPAFLARKYPAFFDPPNPSAHALAGCGAYSGYEGELDAWKCHSMAFRANWKASFDFPHMGMFLPPVGDDEEWIDFRGVPTSIRHLRDYSRRMREMGFHVLNYFNVTEYGAYFKYPPPPRKAKDDADLWKDANDFLFQVLGEAILPGPEGKPIGSWCGCVAMDPGEPVYRDFLAEQARRHVEKLPDSSGICIDRMDWITFYNSRRDDGVSWVDGKPARSLFISWRDVIGKIGPIFHDARKAIFGNPHVKRLELMREFDGIYEEFTYDGFNLNLCGLLGMRKPVLGWTAVTDNLRPDPDAFFQRFLYLGVFPTAPLPENDHTINPDPWAERYYLDYGPLLDGLVGKRWVLEPRPIEVVSGGAKANLFEVPGGYAVPVVLGGDSRSARVRIRGLGSRGDWRVEVLHPGKREPSPLRADVESGDLALDVPLVRGCALLRVSSVWIEPRVRCFAGKLRVAAGTTIRGAQVQVRQVPAWNVGSEATPAWAPLGPDQTIDLTGSATIQVAAFEGGRMVGGPVQWDYRRLPPPAPWIEPRSSILKDPVAVRMGLPVEVRGAAIRYTVDGSEPGPTSALYTAPIPISETSRIRARTFLEGSDPSLVVEARLSRLPPLPPAPDVALSDLSPASATVGWGGTVRKDRSIQDRPLSVAGKARSRGMGAHSISELAYDLEPRFARFVAVVGVDDEMKDHAHMASVTFSVSVDGKVLGESPVLRVGEEWRFDVAIPAGSRRIVLVAGDARDGINADHADWVDAGFVVRGNQQKE